MWTGQVRFMSISSVLGYVASSIGGVLAIGNGTFGCGAIAAAVSFLSVLRNEMTMILG